MGQHPEACNSLQMRCLSGIVLIATTGVVAFCMHGKCFFDLRPWLGVAGRGLACESGSCSRFAQLGPVAVQEAIPAGGVWAAPHCMHAVLLTFPVHIRFWIQG